MERNYIFNINKKLYIYILSIGITCFSDTFAVNVAPCEDDGQESSICTANSPWNEVKKADVQTKMPGLEGHWVLTLGENNDFRVRFNNRVDGKDSIGELLMVGARKLALKDVEVDPEYAIDLVDTALLGIKLPLALLHQAFPLGPDEINKRQKISINEKKRGLDLATPSAAASFGAPWKIVGSVYPKNQLLFFDLKFTFIPMDPLGKAVDKTPVTITAAGSLDYRSAVSVFPDTMSMKDWKVFGVGPLVKNTNDGTIYDYGSQPATDAFPTLGDLRKAMTADNGPGVADPNVDFTGFWKEECDQGFGLRISPQSNSMYDVSFCGPGGCSEPGTYRPSTYINKDPSYEVVSADEIKVRGTNGWSTYHKCSSDSAPKPTVPE